MTGEVSVFANKFDGYVYEQATGEVAVESATGFDFVDPSTLTHAEEEEALAVYRFVATDADFYGAEAEATIHLHENAQRKLDLRLAVDFTHAEDGAGVALPRIPAARYTTGIDWASGAWSAGAEYQFTAEQDRVAENESASDSYGLLSVYAAWRTTVGRHTWELFVRGTNLTDEEARPHTSFLKDLAPLPGRNVTAGVRWVF